MSKKLAFTKAEEAFKENAHRDYHRDSFQNGFIQGFNIAIKDSDLAEKIFLISLELAQDILKDMDKDHKEESTG